MSPLVSIIIPCHNAAPWVADCLDSVLAQTLKEIEIIVVDDASSDESTTIVGSYAARGVTLAQSPRRGAAAARNHGLSLARGSYIQFLDADDLLHPDKLTLQVQRLKNAGPDQLASGEWARFIHSPSEASFGAYPLYKDLTGVEFLQLSYEQTLMLQPAAWLSPRPLLDKAGPWNESLSLNDDGEYFARVILSADRILFCPHARVFYRSNVEGSLSSQKTPRHLQSLFDSINLTLQTLLHKDTSTRTREAAAFAWKWTAFELWPGAPDLSRQAEKNCLLLGGSERPFPAGPSFKCLSKLIGWRLTKRLRDWQRSRTRR